LLHSIVSEDEKFVVESQASKWSQKRVVEGNDNYAEESPLNICFLIACCGRQSRWTETILRLQSLSKARLFSAGSACAVGKMGRFRMANDRTAWLPKDYGQFFQSALESSIRPERHRIV